MYFSKACLASGSAVTRVTLSTKLQAIWYKIAMFKAAVGRYAQDFPWSQINWAEGNDLHFTAIQWSNFAPGCKWHGESFAIYRKASPLKMLASFWVPIFRTKKDWFTVRNPLQLVDKPASDLLLTSTNRATTPVTPQRLLHGPQRFFFHATNHQRTHLQRSWNQMWLQKGTCHSAMSRSSWCLIQDSPITQLHKFSPAFSRSIPTLHQKKQKTSTGCPPKNLSRCSLRRDPVTSPHCLSTTSTPLQQFFSVQLLCNWL